MRSVLVTAPDDTRWTVRVVWEARWRALAGRFGGWRRKRKRDRGSVDVVDGAVQLGDAVSRGSAGSRGSLADASDTITALMVVFVAVIAAAALFWWVLLPLLLIVLDLVIVLVLLILTLVGRVLFRRPWTVEATGNGERITAEVVGWRTALGRRDEIAELLRRGQRPVDVPIPAP